MPQVHAPFFGALTWVSVPFESSQVLGLSCRPIYNVSEWTAGIGKRKLRLECSSTPGSRPKPSANLGDRAVAGEDQAEETGELRGIVGRFVTPLNRKERA